MQCHHEDSVSLSALGRLAGRRNLCYANASVQALLGWTWRPLLRILEAASPSLRDCVAIGCALQKLCGVHESMRISSVTGEYADIGPFMSWVFSLPNARLRDGAMEDPHDLLVPIWERMTMAGGGSLAGCGENCGLSRSYCDLMAFSLCVKLEYECCSCRKLLGTSGYAI
jgi:hypothetical protein